MRKACGHASSPDRPIHPEPPMSTTRRLHIQPADNAVLTQGMRDIQEVLKLPLAFPPEVEAAPAQAAANPHLPSLDRGVSQLGTITPPGAMTLDPPLHVARTKGGP